MKKPEGNMRDIVAGCYTHDISSVSWKDEEVLAARREEGRHFLRHFSYKDIQIKTYSAVYVTMTERM